MKRIYVLIDPRDCAVRYVGATQSKLYRRCATHRAMSKKTTTPVAGWIRELMALGLRPQIRPFGDPTDAWEGAERQAILHFRGQGADLLNVADGGMGCHGVIPSSTTRTKRSATLKARYANDPAQMAARQELARCAGRSEAARRSASERMTAKWAARRAACR